MLEYGFYNSINGDRRYNSVQMSEIFEGLITDGVYPSVGEMFAVTPGEGMQIIVGTGRAWFNATWSRNKTKHPMNIDISDPVFERIDTVCIKVDKSEAVRANSFTIVKGIVSTTPTPSELPTGIDVFYHPIAYVHVRAGGVSITASDIDILVGKSVCPFTTSILQQTNIDALFANWTEQFMRWWEGLKTILDGDVVGNILSELDKKVNISDKATTELAQGGTDDTKWMTPATTNSAMTKRLASYMPLTAGDIRFSVDALAPLKNLADVVEVTYKTHYIGPKPRTLREGSTAINMCKITNIFQRYAYNGVVYMVETDNNNYHIRRYQYDPKYMNRLVGWNQLCSDKISCIVGFINRGSTAFYVLYTGSSGSSALKVSYVSSYGVTPSTSLESVGEIIENSTFSIVSSGVLWSNCMIMGYSASINTMLIKNSSNLYLVKMGSQYNQSPTIKVGALPSGYEILNFPNHCCPSESHAQFYGDAAYFLVRNSTKLYRAKFTLSGSLTYELININPAYTRDIYLQDIGNNYFYISYWTGTIGSSSMGVDIAAIPVYDSLTSVVTYNVVKHHQDRDRLGISVISVGALVYVGVATNGNSIEAVNFNNPSYSFNRGIYPVSLLHLPIAGFVLTKTLSIMSPNGRALPLFGSTVGSHYKSGNFGVTVQYAYSESSDTNAENIWYIVSNYSTNTTKFYNKVHSKYSSTVITGACAMTDEFTNDIIFAPYISTTDEAFKKLVKMDRYYLDVRDNELAQYLWMK